MDFEVIKIGKILPPILNKSKTIMIVNNGGEIIDFYVNKLTNDFNNEFAFIKSEQSLIGTSFTGTVWAKRGSSIIISLNDLPNIGEFFYIEKYRSSKVVKIIDNQIIITEDSVYALHNQSNIRESRLNDLGI